MPNDLKIGDTVLIDDGLIGLEVLEIKDGTDILCEVKNGGDIKNHKGVNVPGVKIEFACNYSKDISDIEFGIENGIDFIAASL